MLAALVLVLATADPTPTPVPEPAPNPALVEPPAEAKPIEPRAEPLAPAVPDKPEAKPAPKTPPKGLPLPEKSNGGFNEGACWGSTAGCAAAGCLPGMGTAVGASVLVTFVSAAFSQGGVFGTCLAVFGIAGGVTIGAPSAVLLGPCASGGALVGGLIGAALDDRSFAPVFLGAIPGMFVALASTAGAIAGLYVLTNNSGDFTTPALILGSAAAVAMASGPITIIGVVVADGIAGPQEKSPATTPSATPEGTGGVQASRIVSVVSAASMAY